MSQPRRNSPRSPRTSGFSSEKGASPLPYPFQGLPPAVSVSAAILVAQQIILSREYVDWIESVGTPRTEAAVRILAAYRDWRDHRGSSDGTLIRECGFGAIEAQMTAGRIPRPAPEHLATIRALAGC